MHSYKAEGIVIKRKNFGEADRILTVFTKNKGKIQIIAKGVRKITSKRASHVELLNHSVIGVYEGKLPILTETECLNHYSILKSDLQKAGYAFYICELVDGLCAEGEENKEVFNLIQNTLFKLETEMNPKSLLSSFEKDLLVLLGFWAPTREYLQDSDNYIEELMERKIKTKKILPQLS